METIPDFISLYSSDANRSSNTLTWNIPQSYYNTTRGNVCYVSMVQSIVQTNEAKTNLIIKYNSGVQNQYSTKNDGAIIGTMGVTESPGTLNDFYSTSNQEPIKCLISARPSQIILAINTLDDTVIDTTHIQFNGIFTLKFEYLDAKEEIKNLKHQQYLNM